MIAYLIAIQKHQTLLTFNSVNLTILIQLAKFSYEYTCACISIYPIGHQSSQHKQYVAEKHDFAWCRLAPIFHSRRNKISQCGRKSDTMLLFDLPRTGHQHHSQRLVTTPNLQLLNSAGCLD